MTLLEVSSLSRHYSVRSGPGFWAKAGKLQAVDEVSFSLAPGKTFGLVGESGCGKSTTARLVLGLIQASSGDIRFEGAKVNARRDPAWRAMRQRMQMVYQNPLSALDRRLPIIDQVAEPLIVFEKLSKAERLERTRELMHSVGLTAHLFERYPHELSGGQRQRVVLARAMIMRPSLLVCDEPVSALDVSIQAQVINLLQDVQQSFGVAYLFISHDLKIVRQISDEVGVMYLGRIVERGTPEQLFRQPLHPYTQALVSAIPSPRKSTHKSTHKQRIILQGDPPNPIDVPTGCSFHPRCPQAAAICTRVRPALSDLGEGRRVACHLVLHSQNETSAKVVSRAC